MTIKDELMTVVRAFNALINAPGNAKALADAQAQIEALKLADQLTDAEQAEVDTALTNASASTPPTPTQVAAVSGDTGSKA